MHKKTITKIAGVLVPAALVLGFAATAFAEDATTPSTTTTAPTTTQSASAKKFQAHAKSLVAKSEKEMSTRLASLSELSTRINEMQHVSAETKAAIGATVQSTTTELNNLKTKIESDSDTKTLGADVKSITATTRVYALVEPQARILATADKAGATLDTLNTLSAKFDARIAEATKAGTDVTAVTALQADLKAKITDAQQQLQTVTTTVGGLVPDNGDAVKKTANDAALKTARTTLSNVTKDMKAARLDAQKIQSALKVHSKTTTTTSTTNQ